MTKIERPPQTDDNTPAERIIPEPGDYVLTDVLGEPCGGTVLERVKDRRRKAWIIEIPGLAFTVVKHLRELILVFH